jgi:Rps23 Pro-64 3,4-dihydroxylase Tpa1-like proline 4-hydroxylase
VQHLRDQRPAYLELTVPGLDHDRNLALIVSKQALFAPSILIVGEGREAERRPAYDRRNSLSLAHDPDVARICETIESHIAAQLASIVDALGGRRFRLGKTTASCVCFRNGAYFRRHADVVRERVGKRRLTWVYYLNSEPKRFSGGDLRLYRRNQGLAVVEAAHGRIVIFRSRLAHEVTTVSLWPDDFRDARFTLTGFVGERATPVDRLAQPAQRLRRLFRRRRRLPHGAPSEPPPPR